MKTIGIIGAGQIGSTLAKKLSALGHTVKMANSRGADSLKMLAEDIAVTAVDLREVVTNVDVLIVSIPQKSIENLPSDLLAGSKENLIIVDTGNYYPLRDGTIAELEGGTTESQWVAEHLQRPVLKAFNNIIASSLADNGKITGQADRIALPVSGDNGDDKNELIQLIDALGFDGVDAGTLSESWRQQPGSPVYCTDHSKQELSDLLQKTDRSSLAALRDQGMQLVMQAKEPNKEARGILRALYNNF